MIHYGVLWAENILRHSGNWRSSVDIGFIYFVDYANEIDKVFKMQPIDRKVAAQLQLIECEAAERA